MARGPGREATGGPRHGLRAVPCGSIAAILRQAWDARPSDGTHRSDASTGTAPARPPRCARPLVAPPGRPGHPENSGSRATSGRPPGSGADAPTASRTRGGRPVNASPRLGKFQGRRLSGMSRAALSGRFGAPVGVIAVADPRGIGTPERSSRPGEGAADRGIRPRSDSLGVRAAAGRGGDTEGPPRPARRHFAGRDREKIAKTRSTSPNALSETGALAMPVPRWRRGGWPDRADPRFPLA